MLPCRPKVVARRLSERCSYLAELCAPPVNGAGHSALILRAGRGCARCGSRLAGGTVGVRAASLGRRSCTVSAPCLAPCGQDVHGRTVPHAPAVGKGATSPCTVIGARELRDAAAEQACRVTLTRAGVRWSHHTPLRLQLEAGERVPGLVHAKKRALRPVRDRCRLCGDAAAPAMSDGRAAAKGACARPSVCVCVCARSSAVAARWALLQVGRGARLARRAS